MAARMIVYFYILLMASGFSYPSESSVIEKWELELVNDTEVSKIFYINPPVVVYDGFDDEMILVQDVYFHVLNSKSEISGPFGGMGRGPGKFHCIVGVKRYQGYYYFLDYPNTISVFDKSFSFIKRVVLNGQNTNSFVDCMDISEGSIYSAQEYFTNKKPVEYDHITVYNLNGELNNHFFSSSYGKSVFSEKNLLQGKLLVMDGWMYFCYFSLPELHKISLNGSESRRVSFGQSWWDPIQYDEEDFNTVKDQNPRKALRDLLLSGDRIMCLYGYRGHILVHVLRDPDSPDMRHGFVVFDPDLRSDGTFHCLEGYQFSGADRYIYFTRVLEEESTGENLKIEVVQCELEL